MSDLGSLAASPGVTDKLPMSYSGSYAMSDKNLQAGKRRPESAVGRNDMER